MNFQLGHGKRFLLLARGLSLFAQLPGCGDARLLAVRAIKLYGITFAFALLVK
jgi:hypothetical protein